MAADEEGFFEDWPKWSKPVFALSAMILLGGVWVGIPLLSAWKLGYDNAQAAVPMDYEPMMALLIAMTTVTITGIFVFMTFRIDRGTRLKAERVAKEKVNELVAAKRQSVRRTRWSPAAALWRRAACALVGRRWARAVLRGFGALPFRRVCHGAVLCWRSCPRLEDAPWAPRTSP